MGKLSSLQKFVSKNTSIFGGPANEDEVKMTVLKHDILY